MVSVVIPSINSNNARQALESVLRQEGIGADEVIITGRNLEELLSLQTETVRIINHGYWLNASAARNLGAKSAKGEILLFLDDDCLAAKDWVESNVKALSENQDIAAVLGRLIGKSERYFARCADLSGFWVQQNTARRVVNSGYAASLGIRRQVFEQLHGFNEAMDMVEDCDLYRRIGSIGYKVIYEPRIAVYHNHGKDTLIKLISFMYEGGRNYRRYFARQERASDAIGGLLKGIISGLSNWAQSLRVNKNVYPRQYLYAPGVLIGFMAWHFGFNAEPLPRRCLDTLIFFVTGECNLSCEHCFYWQRLNRHEEITLEQIKAAFGSFGRIKNLLLSGGEPFLRNDLLEICNFFNRNNRVAFISIPTNGSLPGLIASKAEEILSNLDVALTIGLSLDGMEDYHDRLRGKDGLFEKVIETYGRLALLKKRYPCFSITVNPVVSRHNSGEVIRLARFVKDKMPEVDHFWFSIVRGNPRCPDQAAPDATELRSLYKTVNNIFYKDKRDVISQKKIWDKIFEIKLKVTERRRQIVPCQAGSSIGVLDANGDVRACELREPFGNIRMRDFLSVWNSYLADLMRKNIKDKVCHCTHECFIYPSVIKYGARRIIW